MSHSFESIDALFSAIAPSYDRMNDIMSLGLHHVWKSIFVDQLLLDPCFIESAAENLRDLHPQQHASEDIFTSRHKEKDKQKPLVYVDMACGSGDIGGRVLDKAKEKKQSVHPIFVDPNADLLSIAQLKYPDSSIEWRQESAENISLPDNCAHVYTIAFGLRNVADRAQALKKAWEILMPGGHFWCLEFSHPENPLFQEAFYTYLKLLPYLGQGVIGQSEPYAYLADSIKAFPAPKILLAEISRAGFKQVHYEPLSYGMVGISRGIK